MTKYDVTQPQDSNLKLTLQKEPLPKLEGNRIINLACLQTHITEVTTHVLLCPKAQSIVYQGQSAIQLVSEVRHKGLASILLARCEGCRQEFRFETSPKVQTSSGSNRYAINVRAVWGTMATGGGASNLTETLGTMDIPSLSQPTFTQIEQEISDWWKAILEEELVSAGIEERERAIKRGDYHQGIPAISVICDGGWSKRSHRHSYNAAGGVAVIIGAETKRLLYIGVRNKNCYICTRAETQHCEPVEHTCFKNWKESSQAMESDIIVEGFKQAEGMHGVRYMRMIGDGDSSVYARIQEGVPMWGRSVQKLECANHACKCLRSSLEKLVVDKPHYQGRDKLSKATRVRLVSSIRCAIKMRSSSTSGDSKSVAVKKLQHDIHNSIHHIFGDHERCCRDFCRARQTDAPQPMDPVPVDDSSHPSSETAPPVTVDDSSHPPSETAPPVTVDDSSQPPSDTVPSVLLEQIEY
jgi:hypothetical protein